MKSDPTNLTERTSSLGLHILALLTAGATFPLIFMGGLVTSNHAGMSVPDWPNSYGYNMFLFPPSKWVGGILYEHTHRLMATVVGVLSIALVLWAWRAQIVSGIVSTFRFAAGRTSNSPATLIPREPHRYLALAVLGGVIFQGVLGGLRVVLVKLDLAIVHACVAQAFFCLTAYMALVTSIWWNPEHRVRFSGRGDVSGENQRPLKRTLQARESGQGLFILGVVAVCAIFLQLIIGATMRHFDAGLAIPDLPLAYGKILPPMSADDLRAANHYRAFVFQPSLDPVTLGQVWIHYAHRVGALIVSTLVIALSLLAFKRRRIAFGVILLALLGTQVTLGIYTVIRQKPADIASAHVAVGALVLMTTFVLTCLARPVKIRARAAERPIEQALPANPAMRLAAS